MKRFIYILSLFLYGCAITPSIVSTAIGDITTYTNNGDVLKKWEKVVIQENTSNYTTSSAFKLFGVNFYDKESGKNIIISNAVPYIIEYETKQKTNITHNINEVKIDSKEELIIQYRELSKRELTIKYQMREIVNKESIEYNTLKLSRIDILAQMESISYKLRTLYNHYM